jgi:ankyrin repeat protein
VLQNGNTVLHGPAEAGLNDVVKLLCARAVGINLKHENFVRSPPDTTEGKTPNAKGARSSLGGSPS